MLLFVLLWFCLLIYGLSIHIQLSFLAENEKIVANVVMGMYVPSIFSYLMHIY